MDFFFIDDAGQRKPSRKGVGELVAIGGVIVPDDQVRPLREDIEAICSSSFGFPEGEVFKWSPKADHWMRTNLVSERREDFFAQVLDVGVRHGVHAQVTICDKEHPQANKSVPNHEMDVTTMALERFNEHSRKRGANGMVIAAQPGGGPKDEGKFLDQCLGILQSGTDYVDFKHIAMNVLTTPFRHSRILQLADLVVSCTTALAAGNTWAEATFNHVKPLLMRNYYGVVGGYGLKLYPDRYLNLYHWLLGDDHVFRQGQRHSLPLPYFRYASDPHTP